MELRGPRMEDSGVRRRAAGHELRQWPNDGNSIALNISVNYVVINCNGLSDGSSRRHFRDSQRHDCGFRYSELDGFDDCLGVRHYFAVPLGNNPKD